MEDLRQSWNSKMEDSVLNPKPIPSTIHINQAGTKFQTSDPCFPNQFLQPNNKVASCNCPRHKHKQHPKGIKRTYTNHLIFFQQLLYAI